MSYKKVTRADVAKYADVSETVVSYVLNKNRYVDADKRRRVLSAVEELHYYPNHIARALKGKSSNHILFIADHIANEHFGNILDAMDQSACDKGYLVSLAATRNSGDFVSQIVSRQVDGVVVSSASFPEAYIERLLQANIPVVLLMNREYRNVSGAVGRIDTGLYPTTRECVRLLAGQGRRHIVYLDRISKHGNFYNDTDFRYRGFREQILKSFGGYDESNIITGCASEEELYDKVRLRLERGPSVDAFLGRNDILACAAVSALNDTGRKIPGDVAVIGFNNSSLSKYVQPRLTTVELQSRAIGQAAFDMLENMIMGGAPESVSFSAKIIVRETT